MQAPRCILSAQSKSVQLAPEAVWLACRWTMVIPIDEAKRAQMRIQQQRLRSQKDWLNRQIVDVGNLGLDKTAEWLRRLNRRSGQKRVPLMALPMPADPRILWVGANRNQDYSGFRQSLNRVADVTDFVNEIGGYGLRNPRREGIPIAKTAWENAAALQKAYAAGVAYDLVLGQMWRDRLEPWVLDEIRAAGTPVVNIAMDERLPLQWLPAPKSLSGAAGLACHVTLTLTTSPTAAELHSARGLNAAWWPLASDPANFENRVHARRDIRCSFIGSRYGARSELIANLASLGVKVECFGNGWPNGPIDFRQMADVLSRSRLSIGSGFVGYSTRTTTMKLRDFDVPMSGALYATNPTDELERLYPGGYIYTYETVAELAETISSVTRMSAEEWTERSQRTRDWCKSEHTWDQRIRELFSHLWPLVGDLDTNAGNE